MTILGLEDWTKTSRVKVVIKELELSHGVEAEPCTHATRRIMTITRDSTLPKRAKTLLTRSLVQVTLELMGGLRVGEATGGGDGHGLLANHLCLMRPVGTEMGHADEVVQAWIADSKTGFSRHACFVGKSRGALQWDGASYIRALWKEMKLAVKPTVRDGMTVESTDYSVCRVSILDMDKAVFDRFVLALANTYVTALALHAKYSIKRARERRAAGTLGEELRYVNITGGEENGPEIKAAKEWALENGLSKYCDIVPGPLLRATNGKQLTHMPLAPGSSYQIIFDAVYGAYEESSKMSEVDTELDLDGLEKPKFAHHTMRRTADKWAREAIAASLSTATNEMVDVVFGWKQAEREKDQQFHYAGPQKVAELCKVTMFA